MESVDFRYHADSNPGDGLGRYRAFPGSALSYNEMVSAEVELRNGSRWNSVLRSMQRGAHAGDLQAGTAGGRFRSRGHKLPGPTKPADELQRVAVASGYARFNRAMVHQRNCARW